MTSINSFKTERSVSILLLIITASLWSLGGLLIKLIDWNPLAIAGARSIISAIVILVYLKKPKITWSKPQLGATLAYVATVIFFVIATKMTTAANAILLQFTAPIYVTLLSPWLLKEKTRISDWLIVLTVLGGMALFFLDNLSLYNIYGNLIAAASGISFAFFTLFMRMQKNDSPLESVLLGNIVTSIICIPFIFQAGPGSSGWLFLIILGVLQLGLPYILYSKAIKHVSAIDAILIPVIEPLLNPVWVFLFLGETPGSWALIGGIIVLAAITGRSFLPILKSKDTVISNVFNDIKSIT
ncbi:EamA family transporter [Iocasia frigidifontis]|uniref:EamA family transporter n=1 Tax=Iocasia fonsfrigidae TaxID=2682810 RepID=A0A8A7KFI8_9FIRM|nr:EamA family transporter [Iocasia fonsfrigidae]QTL98259.1 EamA family transporter [Iocasia fonsfrigidae]